MRWRIPVRLSVLAIVAALCPVLSARAEVNVTGVSDDVRIEVDNASVEDVMDALGANFGLRYRTTAPLSRRITGTHSGPLQRVIGRVLDGYDFVVKTDSDGIEVTVYGAVRPESIAGAAQPEGTVSGVKPEETLRQSRAKAAAPSNLAKKSTAKSRRETRRKRHAE